MPSTSDNTEGRHALPDDALEPAHTAALDTHRWLSQPHCPLVDSIASLDPIHEVAAVTPLNKAVRVDGLGEAGPATSAGKFVH